MELLIYYTVSIVILIVAVFILYLLLKKDRDKTIELTGRETQLYKFLKEGKTASEIAEALNISKRTTEVHIYNIYKKLGVNNKKALLKKTH